VLWLDAGFLTRPPENRRTPERFFQPLLALESNAVSSLRSPRPAWSSGRVQSGGAAQGTLTGSEMRTSPELALRRLGNFHLAVVRFPRSCGNFFTTRNVGLDWA